MKKTLILTTVLCFAALLSSCKKDDGPSTVPVQSVSVSPATLTLEVGNTSTLTATVSPTDATEGKVVWTSSNEAVATVSEDGLVSAVAEGSATVTATAGGVSGSSAITVSAAYVPYSATLSAELEENGVVSEILTKGADPVEVTFTYTLDRNAAEAKSLSFAANEALVDTYNSTFAASAVVLPSANYSLSSDAFSIETGAQSAQITVTLNAEGLDAGTSYVLPLSAAAPEDGDAALVAYIAVSVRSVFETDLAVNYDYGKCIFYVNTEKYSPLMFTRFYFQAGFSGDNYFTPTFIVNLRRSNITIDSSIGRAELSLGYDLSYVLEHRSRYIMPLQDLGIKVLLSIDGEDGIGFCQLSDEQIADFTSQVVSTVNKYGLDGVNLFDRNATCTGEIDKTSYPKLIKVLKEALGEKLVTVVDYEDPTAYFGDTSVTGGISVGDYLDYAWQGYASNKEPIQVVDPWNQGGAGVSTSHPRTPFAGMDKAVYGCVNSPILSMSENNSFVNSGLADECDEKFMEYFGEGLYNNLFVVTMDMITNPQGEYEGKIDDTLMYFGMPFMSSTMVMFNRIKAFDRFDAYEGYYDAHQGYDAFLKDWASD